MKIKFGITSFTFIFQMNVNLTNMLNCNIESYFYYYKLVRILEEINHFTRLLEMVPWNGCKAGQIASSPRTEDCVGCKRCESACPTDFLSVRVYLGSETTRSMGLAY